MYNKHDILLSDDVFTDWKAHYSEVFSRQNLLIHHRLHELPHFRTENLVQLIDRIPDDRYDLVRMGPVGSRKHEWRRGDKAGVSGQDILTAIEKSRFWISLMDLQAWDEDFARLTDKIFADIASHVPGFESFKHKTGMLVSSPGAQVYYHCDIPGQSLWQIQGKKSVFVYPNSEPFLDNPQLENVFLGKTEEEIKYQEWFDEFATEYVLAPGEMLHWPLNGPHRVENHDMVNISVTTEHFTKDIRDFYAIVYANGLLRRLGISPSRYSAGGAKYAKAAIAAGHKMVWRKLVKARSPKAARSFRINLDRPDLIEDIA